MSPAARNRGARVVTPLAAAPAPADGAGSGRALLPSSGRRRHGSGLREERGRLPCLPRYLAPEPCVRGDCNVLAAPNTPPNFPPGRQLREVFRIIPPALSLPCFMPSRQALK